MRDLSRFCLGVKLGLNYAKIKQPQVFQRWLECSGRNLQFSRHQHKASKTFEGPSLQDFIAKEQIAQSTAKNYIKEEAVPYVSKLNLNGEGRKVYFHVQGCQMNISDIEIVWSILEKNGYKKTKDMLDADVVLIMTCTIRESADKKIWSLLNNLNSYKARCFKQDMKVGVLGCLAERLKEKLLEISKTVDLVAGPDSYKDLPRLLALTRNNQKAVNVLLSLDETYADVMPVNVDGNTVTAFISIMRGCDNMCTYCIVPFTRGRERSRPMDSILDEVRMLSDRGVKQITLLGRKVNTVKIEGKRGSKGQNVNSYRDLSGGENKVGDTKMAAGFKTVYKVKKGGVRFDVLLDKVSQINPNIRIRFTSPHPKDFSDEVLYLIKERKNICNSLHLPAQSGSTTVLERMRRGYTREAYLELVDQIRSIIPDVYLATDIITGFCGETEQDHEDTLDLLRKVRYNFVHHFPYSMREKTTAHRRYEDDVPREVKIRRLIEIEKVFRTICKEFNETLVNQIQLVLIDGFSKKSEQFVQGRNDGNLKVVIPNCSVPVDVNSSETRPIQFGDYLAVKIINSNSLVLKGEPLYHTSLVAFDESLALNKEIKTSA